MSWELSLVFKATVLLGVTLAVVGLLPRTRASRRHLILASAFAALLVLPVAGTLMPAVAIELPITAAAGAATGDAPSITRLETAQVSSRPSEDVQRVPASSPPSLMTMLRALWLIGAASILTVLTGSLWSDYRLQRSGLPWIAGQTLAEAMAKDAGVSRRLTVMVHERIAVPATMGALRPTILLPTDARHWAEPDLRRVLLHELEHVRRGDWWIHLSTRAVCAGYWFHPLVWIAGRQLRVEAERACDDAVVTGMDRADYAEQLVTLAARLSSPTPRLMLSMAKRSDLSQRVSAILNPGQQRGRAGATAAATIVGMVTLLMGTVASLQAIAARDVDQRPVQQASINTTAVAAMSARRQPATVTTPLLRPEAAKPAEEVSLAQSPSPAVGAVPPSYVIGTADALTITVWRQPELGANVIVRPDGKISLPLVNDVQAVGLTPERLSQRLVEALGAFVQSPQVTVQVREINSRRVFITGAVNKPGAYLLSDSMTVMQLIATAGGVTVFADRDAILIARRVDGKGVSLSFDYAAFVSGQLDQDIPLLPGDTVVVR